MKTTVDIRSSVIREVSNGSAGQTVQTSYDKEFPELMLKCAVRPEITRREEARKVLKAMKVLGQCESGVLEAEAKFSLPVWMTERMLRAGLSASVVEEVLVSLCVREMETLLCHGDEQEAAVSSQSISFPQSETVLTPREKARVTRSRLWREKVLAMAEREGYCYLHAVRWSRRGKFAEALGATPKFCDFVMMLNDDDLDVKAAKAIQVYQRPLVGVGPIEYHVTRESCDGRLVGSFYELIASYCLTYSGLRDFSLTVEDAVRVVTVPFLGVVGAVGAWCSSSSFSGDRHSGLGSSSSATARLCGVSVRGEEAGDQREFVSSADVYTHARFDYRPSRFGGACDDEQFSVSDDEDGDAPLQQPELLPRRARLLDALDCYVPEDPVVSLSRANVERSDRGLCALSGSVVSVERPLAQRLGRVSELLPLRHGLTGSPVVSSARILQRLCASSSVLPSVTTVVFAVDDKEPVDGDRLVVVLKGDDTVTVGSVRMRGGSGLLLVCGVSAVDWQSASVSTACFKSLSAVDYWSLVNVVCPSVSGVCLVSAPDVDHAAMSAAGPGTRLVDFPVSARGVQFSGLRADVGQLECLLSGTLVLRMAAKVSLITCAYGGVLTVL